MKLVKPSFEILHQGYELNDIYQYIELAARTCYKSENLITNDSSAKMIDRLINSGHNAMLEHGTVYLAIPHNIFSNIADSTFRYRGNPYSKVSNCYDSLVYITTNYRVLVENNWLDDLQYICEPTEHHEKRISVKFICDRAVAQELTRHRVMSFAMESQRYCNYSKKKYNTEITFCIPYWLGDLQEGSYTVSQTSKYYLDGQEIEINDFVSQFIKCLDLCSNTYFDFIESGWKAENARAVLPNTTKTEIIMTGFISDWKHFFDLRALDKTGPAHPSMKQLAVPLMNKFKEESLI